MNPRTGDLWLVIIQAVAVILLLGVLAIEMGIGF